MGDAEATGFTLGVPTGTQLTGGGKAGVLRDSPGRLTVCPLTLSCPATCGVLGAVLGAGRQCRTRWPTAG